MFNIDNSEHKLQFLKCMQHSQKKVMATAVKALTAMKTC